MSLPATIKERPIMFSGPMVRAILDGRKTQTRRVVKPQPPGGVEIARLGGDRLPSTGEPMKYHAMTVGQAEDTQWYSSPYGVPGDRLWVRETWKAGCEWDDEKPSEIDGTHCDGGDIYYPADGRFLAHGYDGQTKDLGTAASADVFGKPRSPLYMPRWASRILLEVTDVRLERVQDISYHDVLAEGISTPNRESIEFALQAGQDFQALWDSINAKRGHSWESNPWVWVVEFKRIEQ